MRRGLALLGIALLAGLAAWRLLSPPSVESQLRHRAPVADTAGEPSVAAVPSGTPSVAPPVQSAAPIPLATEGPKPARVRGTVFDDDGLPAEAEVQVGPRQGIEIVASTRSGADGTFSLETPAGEWTLIALAEGQVSWPVRRSLLAGEEHETKLILHRGAAVWGFVTGADASPLPGAVVASSDDSGEVRSRGRTDVNGQYRLPIPAERVAIRAEREGLAPATESIAPAEREELRRDLRLGTPRALRGRVVDEDGRAIPEAAVELKIVTAGSLRVTHPAWRTVTKDQGRFVLQGLPDGAFSLVASARSFFQTTREGVRPGGEEIEIVLARGARVTGQVVRKADGKPVESPTVRLVGLDWHERCGAEVGNDGRFTLAAIRPGSYVVAARAKGFAPGESAPFTIAAKGVVDGVRVELSPGGTLRGVVLEEGSRKPVENAQVRTTGPRASDRPGLAPWEDSEMSARSDANGTFELPLLAPGKTEFDVSHEDYLHLWEAAEVQEGSTTDVTFLLRPGGTIQGRLLEGPGRPSPASEGHVEIEGNGISSGMGLGRGRGFHHGSLPPGHYRVLGALATSGRTRVTMRELDLAAGETANLDLLPEGGGRLSGQVRPPSGVLIVFRMGVSAHCIGFWVQSDARGDYEVIGAPPGDYEVCIGETRETITLPEGAYDIRRDFDLPLDTGK